MSAHKVRIKNQAKWHPVIFRRSHYIAADQEKEVVQYRYYMVYEYQHYDYRSGKGTGCTSWWFNRRTDAVKKKNELLQRNKKNVHYACWIAGRY